MASVFTTVLGKPVSYVDLPEAAMRDGLLRFGLPEWQADGLIEDFAHYRRGEASAVSTAVQDVTGQPPSSFRQFVQDYRQRVSTVIVQSRGVGATPTIVERSTLLLVGK